MSEWVIIIAGWMILGLLGTLIQVIGQVPKDELTLTNGIKLSIIGIIFGPINLMATFEKRK
jgi:type III secretory pathway component EscS